MRKESEKPKKSEIYKLKDIRLSYSFGFKLTASRMCQVESNRLIYLFLSLPPNFLFILVFLFRLPKYHLLFSKEEI